LYPDDKAEAARLTKKSDLLMKIEKVLLTKGWSLEAWAVFLNVSEGTLASILKGQIDKVAYATLLDIESNLEFIRTKHLYGLINEFEAHVERIGTLEQDEIEVKVFNYCIKLMRELVDNNKET
jgi:hypothetical protein